MRSCCGQCLFNKSNGLSVKPLRSDSQLYVIMVVLNELNDIKLSSEANKLWCMDTFDGLYDKKKVANFKW